MKLEAPEAAIRAGKYRCVKMQIWLKIATNSAVQLKKIHQEKRENIMDNKPRMARIDAARMAQNTHKTVTEGM